MITPEGGLVVLDRTLVDLLGEADGRTLDHVLTDHRTPLPTSLALRAGLACLVEAGLLERVPAAPEEPPCRASRSSDSTVSAVIVAWNGIRWLETLLPSLLEQTHPHIEIVVVDNGSTDDTAEWVQREYPHLQCLRLSPSRSLAGAINAGVDVSRGDHILVLNQDLRLECRAVEELVAVAEADPRCGVVAANLRLLRSPGFLNGLGNRVEGRSWGTDNAMGHLDLGQFDGWQEVPSACFAACLIPRPAWREVGPADEGFPLYYEDSEWCYRARAHGLRVRVAPRARVFHAFGASTASDGAGPLPPAKLARVVHGRLRFALKLLPSPEASMFVRNYLGEDLAGLRGALRRRRGADALAYLRGWGRVMGDLPGLVRLRRRLGRRRSSPAAVLRGLPQPIPETRLQCQAPLLTSDFVVRDYGPLMLQGRTRPIAEFGEDRRPVLLIVSQDVVDHRMAGPGLRYVEMARAIADDVDAVLAIPNETSLEVPGVQLVPYNEADPMSLQVLVENSDAAVTSGYMFKKFPFLAETSTRLVVDLYDPLVLENLHYYLEEPLEAQERLNREVVDATNLCVEKGDFFLCGSERQRDFWLGVLAANGRVNPRTYAEDESLRKLVDVVGMGLPSRPPTSGPGIKGRHPRVPKESRLVLWGGGIWNWLDPLTLVEAWPRVAERAPDARLVFLGTRHPNPAVPRHRMAELAEARARGLGAAGEGIVFIEWVDLEKREALLGEADVGVSLHPLHVETRYSVRARIIDCFWARVPVVVTDGDVASGWVREHGVGRVVPPGDPAAVAEALLSVLHQPRETWERSYVPLAESLRWERLVAPLRDYCTGGPNVAPDRVRPGSQAPLPPPPPPPGVLVKAADIWRHQGLRALAARSWQALHRRSGGR